MKTCTECKSEHNNFGFLCPMCAEIEADRQEMIAIHRMESYMEGEE